MSSHQNADASVSEGVKIEGWGKFVSHQLGVTLASAAQLTVPPGAIQAIVQADGNDVRFTLDGTAPTTSAGFLIKNGTSLTLSAADAAAAKFIQVAATAVVNAIYTL
jgi:hypothetical protein